MTQPKAVGFIPARLESSRLPNKALADICGLPMVIHVYKRCELAKNLSEVYLATDNEKIKSVAEEYGCKVIMTSTEHQTGSDRIAEAVAKVDCDIAVNIQGDEALVNPTYIDKVTSALIENPEIPVAILVNPYTKRNSPSDIKAVLNEKSEVMYFSRTDLPSNARTENPPMLKAYHIVPFRKDFLIQYASWNKTPLEQIEYNEYLRILEKGYKIKAVEVQSDAISVDTQEDLEFVRSQMPTDPFYPQYKQA